MEKTNEELNVTFEKSAFNGELKYKLITTDKLVKEICKTFSAMTDDFIGAKFIRVDKPAANYNDFLNKKVDDLNNFVFNASNLKTVINGEDQPLIPAAETAKAYEATNILRNYVHAEESSKTKPNGELSYVVLYFVDHQVGDGKVKFVMPKDKIIQESSKSKVDGWINAWNRRNDFKYLALTDDAKKCLEGFVPPVNPMNKKEAFNKHGIIWDNLFDVSVINDLYCTGMYNKTYNVCMVPLDIRKFFSMIYGKNVEGSGEKYAYNFTFMLPSNPSVFMDQFRRNNFVLNVVQVDGNRVRKYAEENGVSTNTNKLGFIGLSGI